MQRKAIRATQPDMGTEVYAHILDEDRKVNAQRFDAGLYVQPVCMVCNKKQ